MCQRRRTPQGSWHTAGLTWPWYKSQTGQEKWMLIGTVGRKLQTMTQTHQDTRGTLCHQGLLKDSHQRTPQEAQSLKISVHQGDDV